MSIQELTKDDFKLETEKHGFFIVEFYSETCNVCKAMNEILVIIFQNKQR